MSVRAGGAGQRPERSIGCECGKLYSKISHRADIDSISSSAKRVYKVNVERRHGSLATALETRTGRPDPQPELTAYGDTLFDAPLQLLLSADCVELYRSGGLHPVDICDFSQQIDTNSSFASLRVLRLALQYDPTKRPSATELLGLDWFGRM